jgi:hypothetical protein
MTDAQPGVTAAAAALSTYALRCLEDGYRPTGEAPYARWPTPRPTAAIATLADLCTWSAQDLRRMPNLGAHTVQTIEAALAVHGFALAPPPPPPRRAWWRTRLKAVLLRLARNL